MAEGTKRIELSVVLELSDDADETQIVDQAESLLQSIRTTGEGLGSIRIRSLPRVGAEGAAAAYPNRVWEKSSC